MVIRISSMLDALGGMSLVEFSQKDRPKHEERPCIKCGKPNRHNNAYCSAECCKQHKSERRLKETV